MNEAPISSKAPCPTYRQPSVTLRQIETSDREELKRFYAALSPESRRRRFLGTSRGLPEQSCLSLCCPDHDHEEGFVAICRSAGPDDGRIIGHLCLVPVEKDAVELAVAVADEHQRRGIGRRLFEAALDWAVSHDMAIVTATAFADNVSVLRLLSSAPNGALMRAVGAGVVEIEIPLRRPGSLGA